MCRRALDQLGVADSHDKHICVPRDRREATRVQQVRRVVPVLKPRLQRSLQLGQDARSVQRRGVNVTNVELIVHDVAGRVDERLGDVQICLSERDCQRVQQSGAVRSLQSACGVLGLHRCCACMSKGCYAHCCLARVRVHTALSIM